MPIPSKPSEIELPLSCNECGKTGNTITRFTFMGSSRPEEFMCWECREPYIRARFEDDKSSSKPETENENSDGQTSIMSF